MAEDRKIWPQAGMDARLTALSDLEFRVWVTYLTTANDLGVMANTTSVLQGANRSLDLRPAKFVRKAMDQILGLTLWQTFECDGSGYVWCSKWQDWQQIKWPRKTSLPIPSDLSAASEPTKNLYALYVEKHVTPLQPLGNTSKDLSSRAHARSAHAGNPHPTPHSVVLDLLEESARETDDPVSPIPPAWGQPRRSVALVGNHRGCFDLTPAACGRGICVPGWLGQQWLQQYGDDRAQAEIDIREIVRMALTALPPKGGIGDTPKEFWQAVWKQAHGSQAPVSGAAKTKGNLTLDAARKFIQARIAQSGQAS